MKRLLVMVLLALRVFGFTIPAKAQDNRVSPLESIPREAEKVFNDRLSKTHKISFNLNPYYLQADFNGDGQLDTALLVQEKPSGKFGIAIIFGRQRKVVLIGAGKAIWQPKVDGDDNFDWMDYWYIFPRGPVERGTEAGKPPSLKGDAILVGREGVASFLIYWDGRKFLQYGQGD